MMILYHFVLTLLCIYTGLVVAYYFLMAAASRPNPKRSECTSDVSSRTFAVVIPAHDEEESIRDTIRSCLELEYPRDRYSVYVIADNCTDCTAEIAREAGAVCLERQDTTRFGKGFALSWAFERILPTGVDAILVLDSDCQIEPKALRVFNRYLVAGDRVLQASQIVSNPDDSTVTFALAVGTVLENDLFYAGKSRLGLSVFLLGKGMVFHRDVLESYPWDGHGLTEDLEYGLTLIKQRVWIRFVPEVQVRSVFPVNKQQLVVQRKRWARGTLGFTRTQALKLIWCGLLQRRGLLVDAGWSLLVLSRPLVFLALIAWLGMAVLECLFLPSTWSWVVLALSITNSAAFVLYVVLGIFRLGISRRRLALLIGTPRVVAALIGISLVGLLGTKQLVWERTPRSKQSREVHPHLLATNSEGEL